MTKGALRKRHTSIPTDEIVKVDGRLDAGSARRLAKSVVRVLRAGLHRCTIDLSAVDAVDSAGVGALMGAIRKLEEASATVVVVCASPTVRRLFEISGIARLVRVVPNLADVQQIFAA